MPRKKKEKTRGTDIPLPDRVLPLDELIDRNQVRKKIMLAGFIEESNQLAVQSWATVVMEEAKFPRPIGKFREAAIWREKDVLAYLANRR
jgi:hypothetical protein